MRNKFQILKKDIYANLDILLLSETKKQRPKIIHYRNYKNFENDNFREDLKNYWSLILQMLQNIYVWKLQFYD